MTRTEYTFQYMPLEGRLPGKVMEQQTEDAINDLGIWLVDVSETADAASTLAQDAYDRAIDAQSTADKAQSAADNAQNTADEAMRAAAAAQSAGDQAQTSADEAMAAAKAAQESADQAQESADAAQKSADTAQESADQAQKTAEAAQDSADSAKTSADMAQQTADDALTQLSDVRGEVDSITTYEVVTDGEDDDGNVEVVDLNAYDYFARIHVAAGTLNAPTADEEFFVDCDINSDGNTVRQIAVGVDTKDIWLRYGVPQEEESETVWGEWRRASGVDGVVYKFCGSVETYGDLPEDAEAGDVYNIAEADEEHHIKAGDNVAWTGENWDNLSGIFDTSGLEAKISEVLQVANNAQEKADEAKTAADNAQETADTALEKATEAVADIDYQDSTLTVTKGDGSEKQFTIEGGLTEAVTDVVLADNTLTVTGSDGTGKEYSIDCTRAEEALTLAETAKTAADNAQETADTALEKANEADDKYLPLTGGTLTGDLIVGGVTLRASDGHIVLPSGVEVY